MQIAVLGMGNMGRAVARRLIDHGTEITVWNRTPGKAAELVQAGATEASTPAEAAKSADAVLMSLADDRAVLDVAGRLADATQAGDGAPVLVDMSTVSPQTSRLLRDAEPGRGFVAAPIIGAPQTIAHGRATALVAGERRLVDRLEPALSQIFHAHTYCGEDPGAATTFKLLNNYLLISAMAVVAEVVAAAEAAGLDTELLRGELHQWPTVPPAILNRIDDTVGGDHHGWFSTRLGAKDVRLVAEVAESNGLTLPIARLVEKRFEEAARHTSAEADIAAVVELVRAERGPHPAGAVRG
ncbi:tartronate semialdehyde reductase [Sphaerisporangium siamense]|uniref:3-hydroxyisobutyrate dehydrogenase-like beta-hydroxyacid dehydrogenase n=1 Tax=Sphaerisporangium siamense TaxID=795645 RepID=A0A7W7G9R2_9ACTN|nr:NAD(P)-dependent oxidoreductase [Sphaerisporangium siamense]MBB4701632.1 3-hydroxyisobutyrate dehydrogenase-like beta-hydroxyacid dehydrogenase [Sphaerisporangium siamense]GII85757.1 tartronate semialdehyde reductase [Sphaerisporangium siamense]